MNGKLYIVATPIGNMDDLTARAKQVLCSVSLIAAEDTRHSARLLQHVGATAPCVAYHEHSEAKQTERLLERLQSGDDVALISDAGTPLISDPGYELVHRARQCQIDVVPIPGACALVAALSASGLPTDRFYFAGFLAAKKVAREQQLNELAAMTCTLIFYESRHRILEVLQVMQSVLDDRHCVVGRELTKTFETFYNGRFSDIIDTLAQHEQQQRGEFVVMVAGAEKGMSYHEGEAKRILDILNDVLPASQAAKLTAKITGLKKSELYSLHVKP